VPRVSITSRLFALGLLALSACVSGCSGAPASGSGSPQEAVSGLLAPFAKPHHNGAGNEQRRAKEAQALWRSLCEHVDPKIRRGLHFYETKVDPLANCGAVVSLMIAYTGDTGPVAAPETIKASPLSAERRGDTSVVNVRLRFSVRPAAQYPAPPSPVTVKVLTVRRAGRWFVATPDAVNPVHARAGGLTEAQLRADHAKLLAAAK
jgi:hypothetical protein